MDHHLSIFPYTMETTNEVITDINNGLLDNERLVVPASPATTVTSDLLLKRKMPSPSECDGSSSICSSLAEFMEDSTERQRKLDKSNDIQLKRFTFSPSSGIISPAKRSFTRASSDEVDKERKERRRKQISNVLEQASAVGLAVQQLQKEQDASEPSSKRRRLAHRRGSFVIHRNHHSHGPGSSRAAVTAAALQDAFFQTDADIIDYSNKINPLVKAMKSSDLQPDSYATVKKDCPVGEDDSNSLLSIWASTCPGGFTVPTITQEEKDYYGYE